MSRDFIKEASEAALAGVELAQMHLEAFYVSTREIDNDPTVDSAVSVVRNALWKRYGEACQNLFMWGVVNPKSRVAAKRLAMKKYLSDGYSIMGLLHPNGKEPSNWLIDEEKKFRKQIKELLSRAE